MSVILRSVLRDPRPLSRAIRRMEDDFLNDWPLRKLRRTLPLNESPFSIMEDMSRQMSAAVNRMQNFVEDMEALNELTRWDDNPRKGTLREDKPLIKRTENGNLQLDLDVSDYKPEDLKISLVDDNLIVEAQGENSSEDSYRRSHFKRWFRLPEDCKLEEIRSKMTSDNRLLIDLPLIKPIEGSEKTIPIEVERKQTLENGSQQNTSPNNEKDPQQAKKN